MSFTKNARKKEVKPVRPAFTSPYESKFARMLDQWFRITPRRSTIMNEISGGTTIAMAMIYIIPVSSGMYMLAGENSVMSAVAIAFVTAIISIVMGIWANVPIALSTGMGLNAFAVFTFCIGMGYSYNMVMICTMIEGFAFLILSLTNVRSALINAIPRNMKLLIGVSIGGFLFYIGAQNSKLIVNDDSTLTTLVNFRENFHTQGIMATLAVVTIMIMLVLHIRGFKANILVGMLLGWGIGMVCQAAHIYIPDPEAGFYSLYPWPVSLPQIAGLGAATLRWESLATYGTAAWIDIAMATATMFYSDFFDTAATGMTCVSSVANKMREDLASLRSRISEEVEASQKAKMLEMEIKGIESGFTMKIVLIVDAIGTMIGAFFRITTVTSFVESMAGDGRTGLSSVVTGLWFLAAIFLASVFTTVPSYATGAALIVVGINMAVDGLKRVDWRKEKLHQTIPGLVCIGFVALSYNIANGMAWALILYAVLSLFAPDAEVEELVMNEQGVEETKMVAVEKAGIVIYVLAVILIVKFVYL